MKTIRSAGLLLLAFAGAAGCASATPPAELVAARTAYDRATHGPAAQLDPADLHTARQSLGLAESAFEASGDSAETRELAATAELRTEIAESRGRAMAADALRQQALAQAQAAKDAQAQQTAAQLAGTQRMLASQGQALQSERQRREEAEKRAAQAASDLAKVASSVRQEPRGMVITLSGSVLFVSGKADLLPAAQIKLNEVADALTRQDPASKIVVEGYTDSQGSAGLNQELSERRARTVRDYLVSRGIAADRVTSQGFGPARPVADNASPEGRANNRRVEIIVQPSAAGSEPSN